jgi:hypothetical protein
MPARRQSHDGELAAGLRQYLATGSYAGAGLEVFLLAGRAMRFQMPGPAGDRYRLAYEEIERLWRDHRDEIRDAAGSRTPWCDRWLREHGRQGGCEDEAHVPTLKKECLE